MKGMIGRASDAGPTLPPFTEETFSVESCDRLPRISLEWLLIDAKGMPRGDPERRLGLVEAIGHSPARAVWVERQGPPERTNELPAGNRGGCGSGKVAAGASPPALVKRVFGE